MPIPIGTDQKIERIPWAVIAIIAVTFVNYFYDFGTGEWFIPLPVFQHAGIFHLFFNMLFLWVFGSYLESKVGWVRFVLFYFVCELGTELLSSLIMGQEGIGASGAVSGIMGLYLVRFYHSKIRMVVSLGVVYWRYDLPAKALIAFWFARDLTYGYLVTVYDFSSGIGHWAHVGGFVTGFIIGKFYKYDVDGNVEHLVRKGARQAWEEGNRAAGEKELLAAIESDPSRPEPHIILARIYSGRDGKEGLARRYYRKAVDKYYIGARDPVMAGQAFLEMVRHCGDEEDARDYLKYGKALGDAGEYSAAVDILMRLLDSSGLTGTTGEKVVGLAGLYAANAGDEKVMSRAVLRLEQDFPESPYRRKIEESSRAYRKEETVLLPQSADLSQKRFHGFWDWLEEITSQPLFWLMWCLTFPFMYYAGLVGVIFIRGGLWTLLMLLALPTVVSLGLTHIYMNSGEWAGAMIFGVGRRKSEVQAHRDFYVTNYFNKGMAAEREHEWLEAVKYFNGVLAEDPKHIEARFRLARIYHRRLERKGSAIYEYEKLMDVLPEGAPYHMTAKEAIEELLGKRSLPEPIKPLEWK